MLTDAIEGAFAAVEETIRSGPVYPQVSPEEIRQHLRSHYAFARPTSLEDLAADVEAMLRRWQVQVTHPRYLGLFNPSVTLASVVAETLVALYNPQLAAWRTSPAANEIEKHTLDWVGGKLGLPAESFASFTTGGAEANLTAVLVALTHTFPEYGERGLRSLGADPVLYLSEEAHHSFTKIAHMTGLGRHALRTVASDSNLKLDLADLKRQVAEDRKNGFRPFLVVGTCGTTAAGVIDPLEALHAYCKSEGLWLHVDAAWGGAAALSPALRPHLAGIESADSITCDGHKWFSVPMACGMFFCRHRATVLSTFHAQTSYMPQQHSQDVLDPYTSTVQWSRRFIGLKLFMSLAHNGETGYAAMIEHQARMGDLLRDRLAQSGWQIVNCTPLPVVCFTRPGLDISAFLARLREEQIAWISETQCAGQPVLRACVTSFKTNENDVHAVVDGLNRIAAQ
ncbi:MAG: aminotransferase class V-fold PLP-dependent enzyme [Terracidiphilus sp.]